MKKTTLLLLLLVSFNGFAAGVLVEYVYEPGFQVNPTEKRIQILENGIIQLRLKILQEQRIITDIVGLLAADNLYRLKKHVDGLEDESLIDEDENGPFCADTPTVRYLAYRESAIPEPMHLYESSSCHTYILKSGNGNQVIAILDGFKKLIKDFGGL